MAALGLIVMFHVVFGFQLDRQRLELGRQMIHRRMFHTGEMRHHARDGARNANGRGLVRVADQVEVGANRNLERSRPVSASRSSSVASAQSMRSGALPTAKLTRSATSAARRMVFGPGACNVDRHGRDIAGLNPAHPARLAIDQDLFACNVVADCVGIDPHFLGSCLTAMDMRARRVAAPEAANRPPVRLDLQARHCGRGNGGHPGYRIGYTRSQPDPARVGGREGELSVWIAAQVLGVGSEQNIEAHAFDACRKSGRIAG